MITPTIKWGVVFQPQPNFKGIQPWRCRVISSMMEQRVAYQPQPNFMGILPSRFRTISLVVKQCSRTGLNLILREYIPRDAEELVMPMVCNHIGLNLS